ncbi:MAG: hypothetical protein HZA50_03310 [Planctomycetes bacterium]|nr:hypothetical protein [Planctomycetota bacterium]
MANEQTYMDDVAFLRKHTRIIELAVQGDARIAVAPAWQGRVMTSTLSGETGAGYGWINRKFIEEGKPSEEMNKGG